MLAALAANGVSVVVVERLDRLARDLMIQESIISSLRKGGFELQSAHEPDLSSDDPSRVAFRQMAGVFAQWEKAMIVRKLRAARQRKRQQAGRCEGRKPYGYRPGERKVLERIRALRESGATWAAVAEGLNAEGVRTRYGRRWQPQTACNLFLRGRSRSQSGSIDRSGAATHSRLRTGSGIQERPEPKKPSSSRYSSGT
jgi:DNA invertase Pin-like site-specific DNA recombinase